MKKILAFLCICVISMTTSASSLPDFPFVVIHGKAEMEVKPSKAVLTLEVIEFNKSSEEATLLVFKKGNEILALANKYGVSKNEVKSSMYNKETKRVSSPDGRSEDLAIAGYEVSQSFTIEINNLEKYTNFVDSLAALQNVSDLNVNFEISNREELLEKLTTEASKNAYKKAISLASGLGQKIEGVFAATESSDFGSVFSGNFGVSSEYVPPASMDFVPDQGGSNMFIPKSITVNTSVTVIFKIKPNT